MREVLNALRTFDQTPWAMHTATLYPSQGQVLGKQNGVTVEGADLNTLENRR